MPSIPELEAIRKAQILEAALFTIAENGCANVTMDDICKAAGLSKGGLAHYYHSKKDLFYAVFEEFFDQIFKRSRETMAQKDDPLEKLLSFDWLYDRTDPDAPLAYPILFDFLSITVHDDQYKKLYHEWICNWVVLLSDALKQGISDGLFPDLDVEKTARTISSIYNGIATRWYLDHESHSTEWAIDAFKRSITGLLYTYAKK
ncbi:MAG: TetR/AcrR family transcriptional regulator [Deltaproteobacteria bacterium]|nr:TetR/AcrR family transcriptional regulator [Deltaproteobacteria bacterium]